MVEPIATKDSFLKKSLQRAISKLSIIQNQNIAGKNPLYKLFEPISEELKCAIATRGDRFNIFPGLEIFLNLEHLVQELNLFNEYSLTSKPKRTLTTLIDSLQGFLDTYRTIKEEIIKLIPEFQQIREILSKRTKKSPQIQKEIKKWTYKLESRLKRRDLDHDPSKIKWLRPSYTMNCAEIWQQWIRLVKSYEDGLLIAYNLEDLDFTNNAKEQLFHRSKHHFKALLGRDNVSNAFLNHGALHVQLLDIDFSKENVSSVLLASETPLIEAHRRDFHAQYATVKRTWKIREIDTGNLARFENNLKQAGTS